MYLAKIKSDFAKLSSGEIKNFVYKENKFQHGHSGKYCDQDEIQKILTRFVKVTNIRDGDMISFNIQRRKYVDTIDTTWHRNNVDKIGILCIDRQNINGGIHLLKSASGKNKKRKYKTLIEPGKMLIFDDQQYLHRITPLYPVILQDDAWQDLIILSSWRPDNYD